MWVPRSAIKDCVKKKDSGIESTQYDLSGGYYVFLPSNYTHDITAAVLVRKYNWVIFRTLLLRKNNWIHSTEFRKSLIRNINIIEV
jgi:hypothetical protein